MVWSTFDNGATIGQRGSEEGMILRDDEHTAGARITLEKGCRNAPYAVTCGIYGWFFHTRYLSSEAEAELPAMVNSLEAILGLIPRADDPAADRKQRDVCEAIQAFVDRFPN